MLAEYEDESGVELLSPAAMFCQPIGNIVMLSHPTEPWLRQSPDAFAEDANGELGQVEAKTAMRSHEWSPDKGVIIDRWDDAHTALVPAHYAIQGYVQLAVSGLPWVDLCALIPKSGWLGVRWVRLLRDPDTQSRIVDALGEWRERHLVRGEAPLIDGSGSCNRHLTRNFPAFESRPSRDADPTEREKITRLAELRAQMKTDKTESDILSNELIATADGHRLQVGDFGGPYGQPQTRKGRSLLDAKALRAEAPELVAKHTTTGKPGTSFNLYRFE